jgi:hypothetical protein
MRYVVFPSLPFGLPSSASATAKTSEKYRARVSGGGLEGFTDWELRNRDIGRKTWKIWSWLVVSTPLKNISQLG